MALVDATAPPSRRRLRPLLTAAGRPAAALVTATALFATLLQGTAQAAPRHSVPVKQDEFVLVNSQGTCRVGHQYQINASSAAEAGNLAATYRKLNGRSTGAGRNINTFVRYNGGTSLTVWGHTDVSGIPSGNCIDQKVAPHKGRALGAMPRWAQELLAAAAGVATALAVTTFATALLTAASGGTATFAAAAVGGCVGGLAGHVVYQSLTPDRTSSDLQIIQAVTACLGGAAGAAHLGTYLSSIQKWVTETATIRAIRAAAATWVDLANIRFPGAMYGTIRASRARLNV